MSSKFVWEEGDVEILYAPIVVTKGGAGSGHYGHSGRPGEHGGSLPGKGSGLVVSDTFTGVRCSRAVIMNGKVYEGDEYKGAYHTPTMARMVVAGHIPNSLHMKRAALEIIYDKIPEDSEFESKIMRMTDAYDVQLDNKLLIVDQEKIPRYGENVGVSEGINSLLKKFQRDVKRGIIDPIGCNEIFLSYSTASVRIPFFELDDIAQIIWNDQYETVLQYKHVVVVKGGSGSGDFGHSGRPGLVGGSGVGSHGGGSVSVGSTQEEYNSTSQKYMDNLDEQHFAACRAYQSHGSVNAYLRGAKRNIDTSTLHIENNNDEEYWNSFFENGTHPNSEDSNYFTTVNGDKELIGLLDESMGTIDTDTTLWRGALGIEDKKYSEGKFYTDPAFVSTTSDKQVTERFGTTLMELRVVKGTPLIPIGASSRVFPHQDYTRDEYKRTGKLRLREAFNISDREYLLGRNLVFKFQGEYKKGGYRILKFDVSTAEHLNIDDEDLKKVIPRYDPKQYQ